MAHNRCLDEYNKYYAGIGFAREGLFKLVAQMFEPEMVLYPGCSIHATPSFYFPHVIYVDQSPTAKAFFSDTKSLSEFLVAHKKYPRTSYAQFLECDFTKPLPLPKSGFDLVLSLFAGGISLPCKTYLKKSGVLLTNNHHGDAVLAATDPEYRFLGTILEKNGRYHYTSAGSEGRFIPPLERKAEKTLRKSKRIIYSQTGTYFLFERVLIQKSKITSDPNSKKVPRAKANMT